jgi:HJR/Mrr/RecB family endonuclease
MAGIGSESLLAFALLWPVWATLAALVLLRAAFFVPRWVRHSRAGLNAIDRMVPATFGDYIADMFEDLGHAVEIEPEAGSSATFVATLDGVRTAVQTEHRKSGRVSSKAVEAVIAARQKHRCSDAMVVTNQRFTPKARDIARANGATLCNRDELALMLQARNAELKTNEGPLDRAA